MVLNSRSRSHRTRMARAAFTFLEIMFVVTIIGILLAIAGPKLTGKAKKAKVSACKAQIRQLAVALANYEMHVGTFPDSSQGLKALLEKPSDVDENSWDGPYWDANVIQKDPWGGDYQYKSPGEHNKDYDLWSSGQDKQDNTEDDVKNWTDAK